VYSYFHMSRWFMWIGGAVGITVILSGLLVHKAVIEEEISESQVAALLRLEVNAAREWRARAGFTRDLGKGIRGADVTLLQRTLAQQNFLNAKDVSGFYGDRTQAAVRALQKEENLPETGTFDAETREHINRLYFDVVCPKPSGAYPDFSLYRVDKEHSLPYAYAPADLVVLEAKGIWTNGIICLREETAGALRRMLEAAKKENIQLGVSSGFRSAEVQKALFEYWLAVEGERARNAVAPPGASEHQLGTTVDLTGFTVGFRGTPLNFHKTEEGRWLERHAAEFGFVQSYPPERETITTYMHEPWHYRFVGEAIAKGIKEGNVGTAEYLALHGDERYPRFRGPASGLELSAQGALAVYIPWEGEPKILMEKESRVPRAIASITKLFTAIVAEKLFPPGTLITVSLSAAREAVKEGQARLEAGEAISIEEMLSLLLIESSNPAARALADAIGNEKFIELMKEEAQRLGLSAVAISNVTGLDGAKDSSLNRAAPRELVALFREVLEVHPSLRTILGTPDTRVRSTRGNTYRVRTTNALLSNSSNAPFEVFAGKTGETPRAGQAFIFAAESPKGQGYIIGVLLESEDRFGEAKKLLAWLDTSYDWMGQN